MKGGNKPTVGIFIRIPATALDKLKQMARRKCEPHYLEMVKRYIIEGLARDSFFMGLNEDWTRGKRLEKGDKVTIGKCEYEVLSAGEPFPPEGLIPKREDEQEADTDESDDQNTCLHCKWIAKLLNDQNICGNCRSWEVGLEVADDQSCDFWEAP